VDWNVSFSNESHHMVSFIPLEGMLLNFFFIKCNVGTFFPFCDKLNQNKPAEQIRYLGQFSQKGISYKIIQHSTAENKTDLIFHFIFSVRM
jgi:hypothetical protein